jgi:hypothetical protein
MEGGGQKLAGWTLTFGYPQTEEPLHALQRRGFLQVTNVQLPEWEAGVFARVQFPPTINVFDLALTIERIMTQIQGTAALQTIEVALETL